MGSFDTRGGGRGSRGEGWMRKWHIDASERDDASRMSYKELKPLQWGDIKQGMRGKRRGRKKRGEGERRGREERREHTKLAMRGPCWMLRAKGREAWRDRELECVP